MLPEQIISPFLAAGVYLICSLNSNIAWAATHSAAAAGADGRISISVGRAGWHRNPSFISSKSALHWTDTVLQTRGGSTEDDEGATAVIDAEASTASSEGDDASESAEPPPRNLTFAATKPYDGSPEDPDGIPTRFLLMKKGDREGAKEAFEATLAWREEFDVDTILSRPHPKYDICKALVPHYFAGNDPHNNIVFVQRPAQLDFELMRKNNATIDDLLNHYIYVIEYCWNILEEGPTEGVMTNVLDMRGLSFRNMKNQEYIGFGKRFVNMMSSNYPGRSYKTLIVNAPKWFHALYKIFKPLLRESTRQKIVILKAGKQQDSALKLYLGDSLPKDLLSGDKVATEPGVRYFLPVEEKEECEPGPNSSIEFDMRQFCIEQLALHNETITEVV
mmetsp:Transcript_25484/g.53835  ORF Transcript_25484/g.53835 Transcript_25484/m.53835 type:complete len:391 (+) Transcript_25484:117-1289(+)|eukprot:CAMPEP_0183708518 /NCGR_PEP_ID=MMETSP0737-20130205/4818_1 /TAXON_ID=385413 /ORGANISM="Thalassiosira miniscula, Strain CCMP1093" /LENGTH=390 /DNA_ID=CAMNT_0025936411 /DNA_START=82 /DNA_END=1254 /DNA_ORIENTATION=+